MTAGINGLERTILKLREQNSSRDIRVLVPHADNHENGDGTVTKIRQKYFSLHLSPMSPDRCTLKQTIELDDGSRIESVQYSFEVKRGHFSALVATRPSFGSLTGPGSIAPNPKQREMRLRIDDFSADTNCLIYALLVGPNDASPLHLPNHQINKAEFCFSRLSVAILWGFQYHPSIPFADLTLSLSTFPRLTLPNGAQSGGDDVGVSDANDTQVDACADVAIRMMYMVAFQTRARVQSLLPSDSRTELLRIMEQVHVHPLALAPVSVPPV